MNSVQLEKANELLALKEKTFKRFRNSRDGISVNYPMDKEAPDLTEFAKTCKTLLKALFDAEEKRLTELFDKRLSEI